MSQSSHAGAHVNPAELTLVHRVPVGGARVDAAGAMLLIGDRASTEVMGLDLALAARRKLDGAALVARPCDRRCLALVWRRDGLHAVDLADGGERWISRAAVPDSAVALVSALGVGDSLVVELDWAPPAGGVAQRQWWVLDPATGALRFRFDRADDRWLCPWPRAPARTDAIVYRTRSGGVGLLDPRSGRSRWHVDQPGAPADLVLADDRGVVVAGNFGPVIGLGRARGQRGFARDLPDRRIAALALDGDRAWVLTHAAQAREHGVDRAELAWIDRATGELHAVAPWPSIAGGAAAVRAGESNAGLWPAGGALVVTAGDGILRVLRREDGRPRWSWGIGADARVALAGPPGEPRPVVVAGGEAWIFGAGPPSPAIETEVHGTVTIAGQPAGNASILVGDSEVQTDDAGAYRVHVRARGRLTIDAGRACGDGPAAFHGTTEVVLGSEPSIQADVRATAVDCD